MGLMLWATCDVLGEVGERLAAREMGDLEDVTSRFDHFIAAVVVDSAGDDSCGVLIADLVFELALFAWVESSVLCDDDVGKLCLFGSGYVVGWGWMARWLRWAGGPEGGLVLGVAVDREGVSFGASCGGRW